jgi:hypothetical protein
MVKSVYDPQNVFHLNHNIAIHDSHGTSAQAQSRSRAREEVTSWRE